MFPFLSSTVSPRISTSTITTAPLEGEEIVKVGVMLSSITVLVTELGTPLLSVTSIIKSTLLEVASSGTFIERAFETGVASVLPVTVAVTSD